MASKGFAKVTCYKALQIAWIYGAGRDVQRNMHVRLVTYVPFSTPKLPAFSSALDASFGRLVRTTDAAMVSGASVLSSSSGIRSSGELGWDMAGAGLGVGCEGEGVGKVGLTFEIVVFLRVFGINGGITNFGKLCSKVYDGMKSCCAHAWFTEWTAARAE